MPSMLMVNRLHLYSAFQHSPLHTMVAEVTIQGTTCSSVATTTHLTQQWMSNQAKSGVHYLAHGHGMQTAGARDRNTDLPTGGPPLFLLSHSCLFLGHQPHWSQGKTLEHQFIRIQCLGNHECLSKISWQSI